MRRKNINFKTKKTALFWFSMCSCVNANQVLSDCVVGVFLPLQRKLRSNIAKLKLLKSYFSTWCTVEHLTQTDISDHPLPGHCKEMMLSLAKI